MAATPHTVSCTSSDHRLILQRVSNGFHGRFEDDVRTSVEERTGLSDVENGWREIVVAVQTEQPKRQRPPESKHLVVAVMTKHNVEGRVFCRPSSHVETCIPFVFTASIIFDTNKAMRATIAS